MKKDIPYHLGIIMDGNRRWAEKKGFYSLMGHRRGSETLKKIGKACRKKGVKILTLYAFSAENWNRSKKEVKYFMNLIKETLDGDSVKKLHQDGIKIKIAGQKEKFSKPIQKLIKEIEELTKNNKKGILNVALGYGGRAEIVEAVKKIIKKKIPASRITEETIRKNLWIADKAYPDLIIRTSGDQRLSNFLLWQAAYSELYFSKKYWPDFTEKDLDLAFREYARRYRKFGK